MTVSSKNSGWSRFLNWLRGNWDTPIRPDDTEHQVKGLVELLQSRDPPVVQMDVKTGELKSVKQMLPVPDYSQHTASEFPDEPDESQGVSPKEAIAEAVDTGKPVTLKPKRVASAKKPTMPRKRKAVSAKH